MMNTYFPIFLLIFIGLASGCTAPPDKEVLSKSEILADLDFLRQHIDSQSAYQGLNGYAYQQAFDSFAQSLSDKSISKDEFGRFLTKVVGSMGDRHASVRGYDQLGDLFLPFIVAPYERQVLALQYQREHRQFSPLFANYPYLRAINGTDISQYIMDIIPEEQHAPVDAYFHRAVRELKFIEHNYKIKGLPLPETFSFQFSNLKTDTTVQMRLESDFRTYGIWEEKFSYFSPSDDSLFNDSSIATAYMHIDSNQLAYLHIPSMVRDGKAPVFFELIHAFMQNARNSRALIIDVRSNGGGRRDLIMTLSEYLVHPDSIYVVNVARQLGQEPIDEDLTDALEDRYLFPFEAFDQREQQAIQDFLKRFQPMYNLPADKFLPPRYTLFNGAKKSEKAYHYSQPVYVLINERSFSAASVLAAMYKGLPNVTLVGRTTDGSSGNSKSAYLPHSNFRIKLSTMVSFQKDGKILDGYGTEPDLILKRRIGQIMWKGDDQLTELKKLILQQ